MGPAAGGLQGIGCGVAWDLRTLQGAARLRPFDFAQGRLRGTAEAAIATWVLLGHRFSVHLPSVMVQRFSLMFQGSAALGLGNCGLRALSRGEPMVYVGDE